VLYRHRTGGVPLALLREHDSFGFRELDLALPALRFWADSSHASSVVDPAVDARRVEACPTPAALLDALPQGDNWHALSKRSLDCLYAWFLLAEDRQRRLDTSPVELLSHQVSLVSHILDGANLSRVLIGDEVGLGKTVEAGLLVKRLLAARPGMRVLYLAPARLAYNVRREFDRLGLPFRLWVSGEQRDASLRDPCVIASLHRAATRSNFDQVISAPPWDVIVVDECHHLSDWAPGGGNPRRNYSLVSALIERQPADGRLIQLSGTPHQGHRARFENLLALLRGPDEPEHAYAGRVIYRTKDDVQGWEGEPLFPARKVNEPLVLDLRTAHRAWLSRIHDLYVPPESGGVTHDKRQRAAGWRCAQALQWATSSVQAGLGYLIRQAIRADWDLSRPPLEASVAAIRPYRLGSSTEPVEALFSRIQREVQRQSASADVDDIEDAADESEPWMPNPALLADLLGEGIELLRTAGDEKWEFIYQRVLAPAGNDKVVLFAQPIETVTALAGFLERRCGRAPALIIGNQAQEDREQQVRDFWRSDGPQFLVSSRAGGEGINLQVAHRLVHVDVPWNPMELEQRVGRVHRFGSRRTILVDTIVASQSREAHAYSVARHKLEEVARALVPQERFEELFSRVMSLVPPEELQSILGGQALAPLTTTEQARIAALVSEGFETWREFNDRFSAQQKEIRSLDAGQAGWKDLARFVERCMGARPASGFEALRFVWSAGEAEQRSTAVTALELESGTFLVGGEYAGMPITGPNGEAAEPLGLNRLDVCATLRRVGLPEGSFGAAHVRWPRDGGLPQGVTSAPFAVWIAARQSIRWSESGAEQMSLSLHVRLLSGDGHMSSVEGQERGDLIRALLDAPIRREPAHVPGLATALREREHEWLHALRQPSESEREQRIAHAVFPLLAVIVS